MQIILHQFSCIRMLQSFLFYFSIIFLIIIIYYMGVNVRKCLFFPINMCYAILLKIRNHVMATCTGRWIITACAFVINREDTGLRGSLNVARNNDDYVWKLLPYYIHIRILKTILTSATGFDENTEKSKHFIFHKQNVQDAVRHYMKNVHQCFK